MTITQTVRQEQVDHGMVWHVVTLVDGHVRLETWRPGTKAAALLVQTAHRRVVGLSR